MHLLWCNTLEKKLVESSLCVMKINTWLNKSFTLIPSKYVQIILFIFDKVNILRTNLSILKIFLFIYKIYYRLLFTLWQLFLLQQENLQFYIKHFLVINDLYELVFVQTTGTISVYLPLTIHFFFIISNTWRLYFHELSVF